MKDSTRSIIIIFFVISIVFFYESKRIETASVGMENSVLRGASLFFASNAEKFKSSAGLTDFFNKEQDFWENLKISPKIFDYPDNSGEISVPKIVHKNIFPGAPYSILIVGDSFIAERFGVQMNKEFQEYKDTKVYRTGIYSTGLSRPDYFDWNKKIKELIAEYNPNAAIVMFGANDGQNLRLNEGNILYYGTQEWNEEYAKRVSDFLNIFKEKNIFVFWLGNPVPRDKYYSDKMQNLNSIFEDSCKNYGNCRFIPTRDFLADENGNYADYLPNEKGEKRLARTSDGIHVTVFGAQILAKKVIMEIQKSIKLEPIM